MKYAVIRIAVSANAENRKKEAGGEHVGIIAAVIPAAGYSSRMGLFKPLLPLGDSLLLEKPVSALLEAGIENIYVVLGHNAHLLKPVIERMGVKWIENYYYKQGMYSSVRAGVEALPEETEAFFLLPADTPLVAADTIKQLLVSYRRNSREVLFPVHNGQKGHPPLISTILKSAILRGEIEGGLAALLDRAADTGLLTTGDAGILRDLDTEDDYRAMLPPPLNNYPTQNECEQILTGRKVSPAIIAHSRLVAKLACTIALYLNSSGLHIHLGLLRAASLLHDLAKGEPRHAQKGREILEVLGYGKVASVIAAHMDLPEEETQQVNEHALLFLADKMVDGEEIITPGKRIGKKLAGFQGDTAACQAARHRLNMAHYLQQKVEDITGISIDRIAGEL